MAGILAVVLAGAALAGCSGGRPRATITTAPPPAPHAATAPAPTREPPTREPAGTVPRSGAVAVPRPVDATAPPTIRATGSDYPAIARSLMTYRDWLFAHHPDPALAPAIFQQGTVAYETLVADLATVEASHQTVVSVDKRLTFTVVSVHASLMTMRLRETLVEDQWLDRDHHVVRTRHYGAPNHYVVVMTSDATGRWRIADITQVALDPAIILSP